MHINALAPLPNRKFSAVVISAIAAFALLLFFRREYFHGAHSILLKKKKPHNTLSAKSREATFAGLAVSNFSLWLTEIVGSS